MLKKLIFLSILVTCFTTIACNSEKGGSENNLKCSDSGAIFSLIINNVQENGYKGQNNTQQIAISDSTHSIANSYISFSIDSSFIKNKLPDLESVTASNFFESNKKKISLANEIQLNKNQVFASQLDSLSPFIRSLNLSNVGFNEKCSQALITYHYVCGPKCGYQRYILITKAGNNWQIKDTVQTSVH